MATSIKRTVTNFKVVELVPIFRLPLNKTRFTLQLSGASSWGRWGGCFTTTQFAGQPLSFTEGCSGLRLEYTFPVRTVGALGEQGELWSLPRLFKAEHILTGGLGWVRKEPVDSSLPSGIKGRTQNASERQQISSHLQQLRARSHKAMGKP